MLIATAVFSPALYSNGLNLNGNGAKAVSMAGAFVGLADDYSAVFFNPAGLTQMKSTNLALMGVDLIPFGKYNLTLPVAGLPPIDTKTVLNHYISGAIGFFKPVSERVTLGLYAYVPSGVGAEWKGEELKLLTNGMTFKWESFLAIITVSPAIAVKVTDKFSVGATLNVNYGKLKVKRPLPGLGQYEEDLDGLALGATLGMLYKPSDKFSVGLTFKAPFKAKLSGKSKVPALALAGLPQEDDAEREASWPMWIGFGVAVKPTAKLTVTADAHYTNWKELTSIPITFSNNAWKVVMKDTANFELKWKDALQLRLGFEYKLKEKLAVRWGYYYDMNPSPKSTMNILLPELAYNWLTFGLGFQSKSIKLDFGIEYSFGKKVTISYQEVEPNAGMPGTHNMNILVPTIALTILL